MKNSTTDFFFLQGRCSEWRKSQLLKFCILCRWLGTGAMLEEKDLASLYSTGRELKIYVEKIKYSVPIEV